MEMDAGGSEPVTKRGATVGVGQEYTGVALCGPSARVSLSRSWSNVSVGVAPDPGTVVIDPGVGAGSRAVEVGAGAGWCCCRGAGGSATPGRRAMEEKEDAVCWSTNVAVALVSIPCNESGRYYSRRSGVLRARALLVLANQ